MSLLFHRRQIGRAVAGELSAAAETRLRAHLRTCAACRQHYDALSLVAAATTRRPAGAVNPRAASRERARLLAVLQPGDVAAAPLPASAPARRLPVAWLTVGASLAAVAMVLVVRVNRQPPARPPEITWRGGGQADNTDGPSLLLYASAKRPDGQAGPVRLIGDLPRSGQAQVSLGDYLQFGYRGLARPAYLLIASLDRTGAFVEYFPGAGTASRLLPASAEVRSIGRSIDVGARHRPGSVHLVVLFAEDAGAVDLVRQRLQRPGAIAENAEGVAPGLVLLGGLNVVP